VFVTFVTSGRLDVGAPFIGVPPGVILEGRRKFICTSNLHAHGDDQRAHIVMF
jgi:hypothetical protein